MVGHKFGRLVVVAPAGKLGRHLAWSCRCDCGDVAVVKGTYLRRGITRSCGCLLFDQDHAKTHGETKTRLYKLRMGMLTRCYNMRDRSFVAYGWEGIRVCQEWRGSYEAFRDWALANGYRDGLTIDRIDSGGHYEPANCRWVTHQEQGRNRRSVKLTVETVSRIKQRAAAGERLTHIAADYGVSTSNVSMVVSGRTWVGV